MGFLTDIPIGFPGYTGRIPKSAATLPRILRDAGYSTFAVGKWHLAPGGSSRPSGPFDRWPLGLGLRALLRLPRRRHQPVDARPRRATTASSTRRARPRRATTSPRTWSTGPSASSSTSSSATPDKPFFLYFATGRDARAAPRAPRVDRRATAAASTTGGRRGATRAFARQVAAGVVPAGTALTARPPWVADVGVAAGRRAPAVRPDHGGVRRLPHPHRRTRSAGCSTSSSELGVLDDTLVLLISDNGTSAEGGPLGSFNEHRFTHDREDDLADTVARIDDLGGFRRYNHYPWGWAWAGNTPLRLWKRYTWLGGVRTPLIVRWPGGIAGGGRGPRPVLPRRRPASRRCSTPSASTPPAWSTASSSSRSTARRCVPTFADADAPEPARHAVLRDARARAAIYHDGWKAPPTTWPNQLDEHARPRRQPRLTTPTTGRCSTSTTTSPRRPTWPTSTPSGCAASSSCGGPRPGRNQVLPLYEFPAAMAHSHPGEHPPPVFRRGATRGGADDSSATAGHGGGFTLRPTSRCPTGAEEGIVTALGDRHGGWALYVVDGGPWPPSPCSARAPGSRPRRPAGAGIAPRWKCGTSPATIPRRPRRSTTPTWRGPLPGIFFLPNLHDGRAGLLVGRDSGFPVGADYQPPFPFTGTIERVVHGEPGPGAPVPTRPPRSAPPSRPTEPRAVQPRRGCQSSHPDRARRARRPRRDRHGGDRRTARGQGRVRHGRGVGHRAGDRAALRRRGRRRRRRRSARHRRVGRRRRGRAGAGVHRARRHRRGRRTRPSPASSPSTVASTC